MEPSETPLAELCRTRDGTVIFSDINIISGMDQTSFLFQQAASVGISHSDLLRHLYNQAAARHGLQALPQPPLSIAANLSADPYEELSHDEAKSELILDSEGRVHHWTPPPDHAWDKFRCDLEDGTATHGLMVHEFLDQDERRSPVIEGDTPHFQDFPLGWTVHPKYLKDGLDRDNFLLARYQAAKPKPQDGSSSDARRVWVLMGGETTERQVSLMSGINVWLHLNRCHDVIAEPFVLTPSSGMTSERSRRKKMLERHSYLRQLGFDEAQVEEIMPDLSINAIQSTPLSSGSIGWRNVWAVPPHLLIRRTVEEIHDSCVERMQLANHPEHAQDDVLKAREAARQQAQNDLADANVEGVARLWSDDPRSNPPGAERMSLDLFARRALLANAVVFVATHGGFGENGDLQMFLEEAGIPFTGSGFLASQICMDKLETARALESLEPKGISTAPKEVVDTSALLSSPSAAAEYARLRRILPATPALCVKPISDGCSTGVVRISCEEDFVKYAKAVSERWPKIPAGTLSQPHPDIQMPVDPNARYLAEPFIETDPLVITNNPETGRDEVEWIGESRWVEVTIGLVGEFGRMHAMVPSITVCERGDVLSIEEKVQSGTGVNLTPPPADIIVPEAQTAARQRCELIADVLGLSGIARIDAFVHADTGELVVIEVNTVPAMTPHTVLLHQALQEDPPMYPQDLFRSVVELSLLPPEEESAEKGDTYVDDGSTWYDDNLYSGDVSGSGDSGESWGWDTPQAASSEGGNDEGWGSSSPGSSGQQTDLESAKGKW
uniref:D-alanine--d-alanine ligase family protein isoform 1 n=2 Tax=Tetraselmis sp. GSL018 TaxID=582737 RepID=A0A061RME5_9CHLO